VSGPRSVTPRGQTPNRAGVRIPRPGALPLSLTGRLLREMDTRQVPLVYARYLPGRWGELRHGYRAANDGAGVVAERRCLYRALVDDEALPLLPEEELIERLMEAEEDDDEPPIGPDGRLSPAAAWWTRVVPVRNDLASYGCEPPSSWAEAVLAGLYATWTDQVASRGQEWPAPPPVDGWDPTDAATRLVARGYAIQRTGDRLTDSVARVEAVWPARVDPRGPLRDVPYALRYMAGVTGSEYLDLGDDWGEMGCADRPWSWCVWVDIFREWDLARACLARSRAALHALTDPSVGAEAVCLVEAAFAFDDAGAIDDDAAGAAHNQGDRVDREDDDGDE